MSTEEIKTVGDMTLEEMLVASRVSKRYEGMPTTGGDHDTISGWCERLGFRKHDRLTGDLLPWLIEQGEAKMVDGYTMRSTGPYPVKLIWSKALEKQADVRGQKDADRDAEG